MGGRKRVGSTQSAGSMFASGVMGMSGMLTGVAVILSWCTAWLSISQALIVPSAITVLVAMIVVLFRGRGLVHGVWSFACIIILLTLILMGSMVWHWPLFMLAMLVMVDDAVFGMVMGRFHDAGVKDDASR